jgi:molybdenum cofactor biosynthesis enzyme MoaA
VTTYQSDLNCAWGQSSQGQDRTAPRKEDQGIERLPGSGVCIRLSGGDPIVYGDLQSWADWAREHSAAELEIDGPGFSLIQDEHWNNLLAVKPGAMRIRLATTDTEKSHQWTGRDDVVRDSLEGMHRLSKASIPTACVIPINTITVATLTQTVLDLSEEFQGALPIILERVPLRTQDEQTWDELEGLNEALAQLPSPLPGDTQLWFDHLKGYPACMLSPENQRPGWFPVASHPRNPEQMPNAKHCTECSFQKSCNWYPMGPAPEQVMTPLGADIHPELLEHASWHTRDQGLGRDGQQILELDRPDLVCFAPYAAVAINELKHRPVPCAQSWVHTTMDGPEEQAVMELDGETYQALADQAQERYKVGPFDVQNEDWSIMDMWNGPLHREMRAQMYEGGPSRRCRDMCRVLLGVEKKRGLVNLTQADSELSEAVAANRRLLLKELNEGKSILTAKPLELSIGVASKCNITCGFCVGPEGHYGELTDQRLEQVIELLPTLIQLSVVGPGEPLMSPNFLKLLEHIADHGYPSLLVSLTTNGTLLSRKWLERHANIRWSVFRISLNAGSAATHAAMTGKHFWDRLSESIKMLAEMNSNPDDSLRLTLSCVLSKQVMGDMMGFAELVNESGAQIILEPMTGNLGNLSPYLNESMTQDVADECATVARSFAIRNREIHRAFEGMQRYALDRLKNKDFEELPWR